MGLLSNTGLQPSSSSQYYATKRSIDNTNTAAVELRCEVTPAPYMLRPFAGLYNPFSNACSVLCNHPADSEAKQFVKRAKDGWVLDDKGNYINEDLTKFQDGQDKEKIRTPHDIVTEDMFRRYTETDSRPLTPAPTLASGKSRGSRRCLTPDQPHPRTTIVLDLRRSHSQETLYYHGYTSDMTGGHTTSATNDRSTLPSLNLSEATHTRLIKGQCEQLPPLASPLVLSKRAERPAKEPVSVRTARKGEKICWSYPISKSIYPMAEIVEMPEVELYQPIPPNTPVSKHRRLTPTLENPPLTQSKSLAKGKKICWSYPISESIYPMAEILEMPEVELYQPIPPNTPVSKHRRLTPTLENPSLTQSKRLEKNQLKALNINKTTKGKSKPAVETPVSQRSKEDKTERESLEGSEAMGSMDDAGSIERRRGKRRRKGRQSDRLTSAGLAAQTQQDPETQIAGIGTDSHNPSSRGSIAPPAEDDVIPLPVIKTSTARKTDSFLDDEILKFLHREVDEEAIETEFDTKRRYVLEEAYRTRPDRPHGKEMQILLKEFKVPAVSLADWLHIPRVFSRQNAQFSLPIDTNALQELTPMQYISRYVTIMRSKQLLYLTVLRQFRPEGFRIDLENVEAGLIMMMGGTISPSQASHFKAVMEWEQHVEEENIPDEIKVTLLDAGNRRRLGAGDCEEMELSDFTMLENKMASLKLHSGLVEILNAIRVR